MRKMIFSLSMAAAILLGGVRTAQATMLTPGGASVTPATVVGTPSGAGFTVVGTQKVAITGTGANAAKLTGFVNEAVIREASGKLDFLYQVQITKNTTGTNVSTANLTDFTGVTFGGNPGVDVTQTKSTSNASLAKTFVAGTSSIGLTTLAQLTGASDQLTASGFSLGAGKNSYILIVKTDAIHFDNNGAVAGTKFGSSFGSFEPLPTPEPSSMLLLAGTGLGFGLVSWRKRRRATLAN